MSDEKERSAFSVRDEVIAEVDKMLPVKYDAVDLLAQADVWLTTELLHYDQVEVSIDYKRLSETTDYEELE